MHDATSWGRRKEGYYVVPGSRLSNILPTREPTPRLLCRRVFPAAVDEA
jgi:hypothetical protein